MQISADHGPDDGSLKARLYHRAALIDVVSWTVFAALVITGRLFQADSWWPVALMALTLVASILAMGMAKRHDRQFCIRCLGEWVDGNAEAESKMTYLRWHHRLDGLSMRHLIMLLVGWTLFSILASIMRASVLVSLVSVAFWIWSVGTSVLRYIHRPLHLWCPWCRHGGRGPRRPRTSVPDPQDERVDG